MGPRPGFVFLEKREVSCPCKESNYYSFVIQPVAFSVLAEPPWLILCTAVSHCFDVNKEIKLFGAPVSSYLCPFVKRPNKGKQRNIVHIIFIHIKQTYSYVSIVQLIHITDR